MDVEDLGKLGAAKGVCPYYAARAALPTSDLVLLPYTGLLSQVFPRVSDKTHQKLTMPSHMDSAQLVSGIRLHTIPHSYLVC